MLCREIRKRFLTYFKDKGHALVPSSSVIPYEDPTLLFVNAGMNQFKDVFLGKSKRDYNCATSSQKCIRVGGKHNDLDNVGHTSLHMTFFEMLGNFSFGSYFKKDALAYAWEVSMHVFHFDPCRIWVSVFETDDETFDLWRSFVDEKRILRLGRKDNFWSMGETGPCGPCSELLYDRGEAFGSANHPLEDRDGERYVEFWNLVFMQYNRDDKGNMVPLPKPCVDTGAGLERILLFMTNGANIFQIDILRELIAQIENLSGKKYDQNDCHLAPAFHVIADHIRTLAFAIADGVHPSNVDRGYVLRKILRRSVRYGRLLGLDRPFLADIFLCLTKIAGSDFHELMSAKDQIGEILTIEEERFFRTLHRGGNILHTIIEKGKGGVRKEISGEDAFKLKDTYGFPIEEILLIAKDCDLTVNLDTYELLEKQARNRSRQSKSKYRYETETSLFETFIKNHGSCEFVGYDEKEIEASIKGIFVDGRSVDILESGQKGCVILDFTPFYAEKGGQVGDTGTLSHERALFIVQDCKTPYFGVIAHYGLLKRGTLIVGEPVVATIDSIRRANISKHHTATHLLHFALQQIVGSHIRQSGSLVEEEYLRFDFNHHKSLTKEEMRKVEALVNRKIWENGVLKIYHLPLKEIQQHPDIKQLFSEKYDKTVRIVDIDKYSKELCGGTHVKSLREIGYFRIAKESSIAKGIRRIEGVIQEKAEALRYELEDRLNRISSLLKSTPNRAEPLLVNIIKEHAMFKNQVLCMRKHYLSELASTFMNKAQKIQEINILCSVVEVERNELIHFAQTLITKLQSGVVVLCLKEKERCQFCVSVSSDLVNQGIHAKDLIHSISHIINGKGGGGEKLAHAGGNNTKEIANAFHTIKKTLEDRVSG